MVFNIRHYDSMRKLVEPEIVSKLCDLWIRCLNNEKHGDDKIDWKFVKEEMLGGYESLSGDYDDVNDADLVSSSLGST